MTTKSKLTKLDYFRLKPDERFIYWANRTYSQTGFQVGFTLRMEHTR